MAEFWNPTGGVRGFPDSWKLAAPAREWGLSVPALMCCTRCRTSCCAGLSRTGAGFTGTLCLSSADLLGDDHVLAQIGARVPLQGLRGQGDGQPPGQRIARQKIVDSYTHYSACNYPLSSVLALPPLVGAVDRGLSASVSEVFNRGCRLIEVRASGLPGIQNSWLWQLGFGSSSGVRAGVGGTGRAVVWYGVVGVILFCGYLRLSLAYAENSGMANIRLARRDIVHGNRAGAACPARVRARPARDTAHVAAAMTCALVVLLVVLLARGASGSGP